MEVNSFLSALSKWLVSQKRSEKTWSAQSNLLKVCAKFKAIDQDSLPSFDADSRIRRIKATFQNGALNSITTTDLKIAASQLIENAMLSSDEILKNAIVQELKNRNTRQSISALFHCFFCTYDPQTALTKELYAFLSLSTNLLNTRRRRYVEAVSFFDDSYGFEKLQKIALNSIEVAEAIEGTGLSRVLQATRYGRSLQMQVLNHAVNLADLNRNILESVLKWICPPGATLGADNSIVYEYLLARHLDTDPGEELKKLISEFLVRAFRDPRLHRWPNLPRDPQGTKREDCLGVMRRWLAIASLDLFLQIIDKTAVDQMWIARRDFWMKYFQTGKVADVTLILAKDADREARRIRGSSKDMSYLSWCKLYSGSLYNHSVLLIKIDRFTIAEWSHSGKMRFWPEDNPEAPKFHDEHGYTGDQLRKGSMQIRTSASGEMMDGIVHVPNMWQAKAQFAIAYLTGIRL